MTLGALLHFSVNWVRQNGFRPSWYRSPRWLLMYFCPWDAIVKLLVTSIKSDLASEIRLNVSSFFDIRTHCVNLLHVVESFSFIVVIHNVPKFACWSGGHQGRHECEEVTCAGAAPKSSTAALAWYQTNIHTCINIYSAVRTPSTCMLIMCGKTFSYWTK